MLNLATTQAIQNLACILQEVLTEDQFAALVTDVADAEAHKLNDMGDRAILSAFGEELGDEADRCNIKCGLDRETVRTHLSRAAYDRAIIADGNWMAANFSRLDTTWGCSGCHVEGPAHEIAKLIKLAAE